MRPYLFSLVLTLLPTVSCRECHNWCHYGILNENCQCKCVSEHITGEHCERAKITRCLVADGDGSCPEHYYCHADNDVCNRGLCSSGALGWCIPLPLGELRSARGKLRTRPSFDGRQQHRRHLRARRHGKSARPL